MTTSTYFNVFLFLFPNITNAVEWFLKKKAHSDIFVLIFMHPLFIVLQLPCAK